MESAQLRLSEEERSKVEGQRGIGHNRLPSPQTKDGAANRMAESLASKAISLKN